MNNPSVPISINNPKKIVVTSSTLPNRSSPSLRIIQNVSSTSQITNIATKDHEYYKKHPKELYIKFRNPTCEKRIDILQFNNDATLDQNLSSKEIFIQKEKSEIIKKDTPMYGAGTEYGKEAREEARIRRMTLLKKKNEQKEPMTISIGRGRNCKKYRSMRLSMLENSQYCVLIRASADVFEAIPVRDWFKMQLEITNKFSKFEDAVEEMQKIDKTAENTNSMLAKKYSFEINNDVSAPKKSKKSQDDELNERDYSGRLILTNNDKDIDSDSSDENKEKEVLKKKKNAEVLKKIKLGEERDYEESDVDDHQGDEVDYMTHSSSNEEVLPEEEREKIYVVNNIDEEASNHSDDEEDEENGENGNKSGNEDGDSELKKTNASLFGEMKDDDSLGDSDTDDSSISSIDDSEDDSMIGFTDLTTISTTQSGSTMPSLSTSSKFSDIKGSIMAGQLIQHRKETIQQGNRLIVQQQQQHALQANSSSSGVGSTGLFDEKSLKQEQRVVYQEMVKYLTRKPISKSNLFRKLVQKRLLSQDSFKMFDNLLEQMGTQTQIVNGEKLFSLHA